MLAALPEATARPLRSGGAHHATANLPCWCLVAHLSALASRMPHGSRNGSFASLRAGIGLRLRLLAGAAGVQQDTKLWYCLFGICW